MPIDWGALQYGALGLTAILIVLVSIYIARVDKRQDEVAKRQTSLVEKNLEFSQRLVEQDRVDRGEHLTKLQEISEKTISTISSFTNAFNFLEVRVGNLEGKVEVVGQDVNALKSKIGEDHREIMLGLRKESL